MCFCRQQICIIFSHDARQSALYNRRQIQPDFSKDSWVCHSWMRTWNLKAHNCWFDCTKYVMRAVFPNQINQLIHKLPTTERAFFFFLKQYQGEQTSAETGSASFLSCAATNHLSNPQRHTVKTTYGLKMCHKTTKQSLFHTSEWCWVGIFFSPEISRWCLLFFCLHAVSF